MFFGRLFESDLMPPGLPQVQLVIWSVAMLAAPGFIFSFELQRKYASLWRVAPASIPDAILDDQLLFVTYSMMAVGLVALIVWEGVFPDRRDVRNLGVLPVSTRAHVIGRLAALAGVACLFCVGANVMSALVYGMVVWVYGSATGWLRASGAHLIACGAAGLSVFFGLITAQGVLLSVFGRRTAQRLALVLQAGFVVVLLQSLMFVPYLGSIMRSAFQGTGHTAAAFLPSTWFVALYNVLAGGPRRVPSSFVVGALVATLASVAAATALLAGCYRRLVRMALESPEGRTVRAPGMVERLWMHATLRFGLPPVQSAIAGFTVRTLTRSRPHLVLFAMYFGIGIALVLSALIPVLIARGTNVITTPNVAILSAPLIMNFWMLCGQRVLIAIPTDIRANWTLRLAAPDAQILDVIRGVRIALLLTVVFPVAATTGLLAVALWPLRAAVIHATLTGAAGVLLLDLLLIRLRKIPFSCTYYPGRSRARTLWPLYVTAFSVYTVGFAELESIALGNLRVLVGVLGVISAVSAALALLRRHDLQPPEGLTFAEEDPDALFAGFRLSEALAAESTPPPKSVSSDQAPARL